MAEPDVRKDIVTELRQHALERMPELDDKTFVLLMEASDRIAWLGARLSRTQGLIGSGFAMMPVNQGEAINIFRDAEREAAGA